MSEVENYESTKIEKVDRSVIIKHQIRGIISRSSVHGKSSLLSPKVNSKIKVLWILCCSYSWTYLIYQIYSNVSSYVSFKVVTLSSQELSVAADFPAVDICNLNPYDGEVSKAYMDSILNYRSIQPNMSQTLKQFTKIANDQFKSEFENLAFYDFNIFFNGFFLTQMLLDCQFQGRKCSPSDFYWYHSYNYGNCFKFNGGLDLKFQNITGEEYRPYPVRKSSKPGLRHGLRLELVSGSQHSQQQYVYKAGFRVIVHNQSHIPFPDQDGVDVPTGTVTNIGISRSFLYRLPSPFSNCIDQLSQEQSQQNEILAIVYQKIRSGEIKQYQNNYCMSICYQRFIVKKCACLSLSLNMLNIQFKREDGTKAPGCYETSDVDCMIAADTEYYNSDAVKQCYSLCPNECNLIQYELKIDQASYPTEFYSNLTDQAASTAFQMAAFEGETTSNFLHQTGTVINIFYDSNKYSVTRERSKITFDILMGNIGGSLSMFTGLSFISMLDFVELFITSILVLAFYEWFAKTRR